MQPGEVRLNKYQLGTVEEYQAQLASAINKGKLYFHELGIRKLDDLDFTEQGKTMEGRLRCKVPLYQTRAIQSLDLRLKVNEVAALSRSFLSLYLG
jgi:hypothetical protein